MTVTNATIRPVPGRSGNIDTLIVSTEIEQPEETDQKEVPCCIITVEVEEVHMPEEPVPEPYQETEVVPETQGSDEIPDYLTPTVILIIFNIILPTVDV